MKKLAVLLVLLSGCIHFGSGPRRECHSAVANSGGGGGDSSCREGR